MASSFKINKRGVEAMMREVQAEFDKHQITVPIRADGPTVPSVVYNGPVITINGDRAQLAWNNDSATQSQTSKEIAPGLEALAEALVQTLAGINDAGLSPEDADMAKAAGNDVLSQITSDVPDPSVMRRGLAVLKGVLAPVAVAAETGAAAGVAHWAKTAVEQLTSAFS